ncbi:hypothetical protein C7460_13017 [Marinoscillum furvescens DSM 4134]|uniref:Uncharacterized protein n=1 Tax=Marinoscillum furvescens DSM 4134 TaxID=1122208 RepID=A0A3D9KYA1_MARFU|nr:hypothetical protein C7460_13017 [Marinoscillum furvescens DSM 4134]
MVGPEVISQTYDARNLIVMCGNKGDVQPTDNSVKIANCLENGR